MADQEQTSENVPPTVTPAPAAAAATTAGGSERPTTCAQCSKRLSRKQHYYRHGRFFCNKRCWRTSATGAPPAAAA